MVAQNGGYTASNRKSVIGNRRRGKTIGPITDYRLLMKVNCSIPAENIKLLIFDLDGTLIDSRNDLANSVNGMLRYFGRKELPLELVATYIGDGAPMLVRRALGD